MNQRRGIARLALLSACLVLCAAALLHAQDPPATSDNPTGRWAAEHSSDGGLSTWYDFRANRTLTLYFGAAVTTPVTHSADTLTMPSGTTGGPPVNVKFHIEANKLTLSANGNDLTFTRVGPAPSASDPLLGKWKPIPPATTYPDPKTAALQKAEANTIYVFAADGTESVRIPFGLRKGTWDPKAHTFQVQDASGTFSFQLSGKKLILGQPPDNKKTESYIPDPVFTESPAK
jgi:hypothetical protein